MKHIRGITLDLDDTLWDIWSVIRRAEVELHRHIESRYPRVASRYDADGLRSLRNQAYETRPDLAHDLTELRRYSFAMILEECDYDPAASHDLMDRFLALRHDVELYPDVLPALEALQGRYPIVALSNGNADINRLAISAFFSGQVSAADAGVKKPDAKIFALGCEALGLEPASGDVYAGSGRAACSVVRRYRVVVLGSPGLYGINKSCKVAVLPITEIAFEHIVHDRKSDF